MPVPRHLLILSGNRRDPEVHRHRAPLHRPEDDRQTVQIQLGPQAVQRHPRQVSVGHRGRAHHPQPPVAGQETGQRTQEVTHTTLVLVSI